MKAFAFTSPMIVVLASAMSASPAHAQAAGVASAPDPAALPTVEMTPFVAMDSRGSTPIGVAISFPLSSSVNLETELGYRVGEGDTNALSSSASLRFMLPRIGRATPYLAAGVGLAQYGAPIFLPDGSVIATPARIAFEVNAGGGLKIPVDEKWGLRTDARWFKPLDGNAPEHWRVSNGISFDVKKR